MPDSIGKKSFVPGRSYEIELKIKDLDYSNDLINCQIISTINSVYDIVKLELFVDIRDILTGITGEDPFKLIITLIGDVYGSRDEQLELELMYIKSEFEMPVKSMIYKPYQEDRTMFPVFCVARKPYKTMNKTINGIYLGKTLSYIIQDLINSTNTGAKLEIDSDDINNIEINQVLIPPMTLSNSVKYLNKMFGIYNGIFNISCNNDNVVQIKNLTKRLNKNSTFTIYHLASDDSENQTYLEESVKKPNVYYTYDNTNLVNNQNLKSSILSNNIKYIIKPLDTLSYKIEKNLQDIVEKYSLAFSTENNKNIKIDINLDDRIRYFIEHTGYEKEENFIIAELSKSLADLSTMSFRIERNLNLLPLLNVGDCVKFNTKVSEYIELSGKYILKSTVLDFDRSNSNDWQCIGNIQLMRTNKGR